MRSPVTHARSLAGLAVLLSLAAPASASPAAAQEAEQETTASAAQPAAGVDAGYTYRIGVGDLLRIAVWKEPELTADVQVRLDGRISVPLLGDILAEGRTLDQLTADIRTRLLRYVEVPQVTVTVREAASARFFVLGEVAASGVFPLTGRTTVIQALALAGGFREFARRDGIVIIRDHPDGQEAIPFNYRDIEAGRDLEQNLSLEPGDTILVP